MLISKSKQIDAEWKETGKNDSKLATERNNVRKQLRAEMRKQNAIQRDENIKKIMDADTRDKSLFYSLVKKSRSSNSTISNLEIDVVTKHFEKLAQPTLLPNYDTEWMKTVEEDVQLLDTIERNLPSNKIPITELEVSKAIRSLNKKKAYDENGISAEHLQHAEQQILPITTNVINKIVEQKKMPTQTKSGKLLPIPKKGKDPNQPTNLRGITISSILGKVTDQIVLQHQNVQRKQSNLQCGFTEGRSPAEAILMVTEAINEATDNKTPIYMATLDVQKAFDTVSHASLYVNYIETEFTDGSGA